MNRNTKGITIMNKNVMFIVTGNCSNTVTPENDTALIVSAENFKGAYKTFTTRMVEIFASADLDDEYPQIDVCTIQTLERAILASA